MQTDEARKLWSRWLDLWNGDLGLPEDVVHDEVEVHRFPPPPLTSTGRAGLVEWVTITRSLFHDLRFSTEVGPIVDGDIVAGRWIAEGLYRGGIPGSTVEDGTPVRFRGNDIWRAEGGLVREYWLSDDLLDLLRQVGVVPSA